MSDSGAPLTIVPMANGFGVTGEIDAHTSSILAEAVAEWSDSSLTIDLSGVEFVDSSGLRTLIDAHQRFDQAGGTLTLAQPSPVVRRLFEISGVDGYLNVDTTDL